MKCPRCSEEVTEGAAFCWACEAPLDNLRVPPASSSFSKPKAREPLAVSTTGKTEELLGFAVFMIGVLWSCGATAAAQKQAQADYTWPLILIAVGVALYIYSRIKRRRQAAK